MTSFTKQIRPWGKLVSRFKEKPVDSALSIVMRPQANKSVSSVNIAGLDSTQQLSHETNTYNAKIQNTKETKYTSKNSSTYIRNCFQLFLLIACSYQYCKWSMVQIQNKNASSDCTCFFLSTILQKHEAHFCCKFKDNASLGIKT